MATQTDKESTMPDLIEASMEGSPDPFPALPNITQDESDTTVRLPKYVQG